MVALRASAPIGAPPPTSPTTTRRARRSARAIIAALAVTFVGAPIEAAEPTTTLDAGERDPAVLFVLTPKGGQPVVRAADVLPALEGVLRAHTDLALRSPEQLGVDVRELDACDGQLRLSCWTRALRPDALTLSEGTGAPRARPREGASDAVPRFLVVLAVHPAPPDGELVSSMFVDLDRATEALRDSGDGAMRERAENRVFEEATTTRTGTTHTDDPAALASFFERLAREDWRPRLHEAGRWEPYGEILVEARDVHLGVELEGRALGTTSSAVTALRGVRPGERTLTFLGIAGEGRDRPRTEVRVKVERGQVAHAIPVFAPSSTSATSWARPATIAGGLGLVAAGAGVMFTSVLASPSGRLLYVCRGADCDRSTPQFRTPCDLGSGDRTCLERSGLLLAPLGYALVAAGATWAGGAWLEDDGDVPWLPLALGVGLGALAYGLSAALDGSSGGAP